MMLYSEKDSDHSGDDGSHTEGHEDDYDEAHLHPQSARGAVDPELGSTPSPVQDEKALQDPDVVDWDGPDDPENPMNWKTSKKITNVGLISLMCFLTPLASSMFAPAVPTVMAEFHTDNLEMASFIVSVFVLGFAFGPLVLGPLSEVWGRLYLYWVCNVLFTVFTVGCAESTSIGMLTGFRFLCGFFGGLPLAAGGGTITDMMSQEHRGAAMALFSAGPLLGPIIGPIAGGYLAQAEGWRWVFWLVTIMSGACTIATFVFMRESYAPAILAQKVRRLRKQTGNPNLHSALDSQMPIATTLKHSLLRPAKLLIFSPIVLGLSIYMAFCFGCMYLLFTTFTVVYQEVYGWGLGLDGLSFLGLGVGSITAMLIFGLTSDRILSRKAAQNGGDLKPEYRLYLLIPGSFCIPIGLFWYGWAAEAHTHWIVPILGTVFVGLGFLACMVTITSYLLDAFTEFSASAIAASAVTRSIVGSCLPLAGRQMYNTMGYGWGNSLLGFICAAMIPIPYLFYKYGEALRRKHPVSLK